MRVALAASETGEVLDRREKPGVGVTFEGGGDKLCRGGGIVGIGASVCRTEVGNGREVQVEAHRLESVRRVGGIAVCRLGVARAADFCSGGRRRECLLHASDGAAFLVDGEKKRQSCICGIFLQRIVQCTHLLLTFHIAVEEDDAADVVLRKHEAAVRIELRSLYADHEKLPDLLGVAHLLYDGGRFFIGREAFLRMARSGIFRGGIVRARKAAREEQAGAEDGQTEEQRNEGGFAVRAIFRHGWLLEQHARILEHGFACLAGGAEADLVAGSFELFGLLCEVCSFFGTEDAFRFVGPEEGE